MENTVAKPQPRSFARRLAAPLILSTAVLSGGGWGAYHFMASSDTQNVALPSADAHSADSAKDELKNLFSTEVAANPPDNGTNQKGANAKLSAERYDRYSLSNSEPDVPPADPPQLQPARSELEKSAAAGNLDSVAASTPAVGDRYAAALLLSPSQPVAAQRPLQANEDDAELSQAEAAEGPTSEAPVGEDVARGQEPDVNPLRAAGQSLEPEDDDLDAQTAFDEPQSSVQVAPIPTEFRPAKNTEAGVSAAINGARSLPQEALLGQEDPRYQSAEPTLADPPSAGYGADDAGPVARQPAPAFDIGQPPSSPQTNALPAAGGSPDGRFDADASNITPTPGLTNSPGTGRPGEQLLEGVQSPSITIQKMAPEEIQVGKRCTYAIRIQNTGQRTAQSVKIHDEVPLGTELVGTAPRAAVSGPHVVWDMGTLSVGEERTVEMELMPVEEGELGSVATVTMAAQASAKARCTRPELALRLSCKPEVLMGQQQLVQIEISNPGSGVATGVMLLENLPAGVTHQAGPALEFEVGTLRPGESRRMELVLTAEQAGVIDNVMTARADANLRVVANCEFEIIAPELKLSIDGPQRRYLERPATYQVTIDNPGTATAKEVQLVTHLPKGLQFVSANNMGEYNSSTHSVQWSLAELPANERGTVELVALPIEPGEQTLQAATKARQGLADRIEKQVLVEGLSALTFEVTDVEGLIEIGGETTYEIVVANQGSKAADNVQVVAILGPGLRAISGQGETQHTVQNERVIFAPLAQLAPKAETAFRIQVQGVSPGDQRVRVMVKSNDLQQPITKEVSTRVYADE